MIRDTTMTELQRAGPFVEASRTALDDASTVRGIGWLLVYAGAVLIATAIALGLLLQAEREVTAYLDAPIQQSGR